MTYDRYDTRSSPREEHSRWRSERDDRDQSRGREDRGFFERAGDEISSWFGDDNDRDPRDSPSRGENETRGDNENRGTFARDGSSDSDYNRNWRREFSGRGDRNERTGRDYRPMTGDYSRAQHQSGQFIAASGIGRSDRDGNDYDRSQTPWGRDDYRRTSRAGTSDSSDRSRHEDPHYRDWRQRQVESLDRDYDEYRREHQSRFESDFGSWRERRQQKRGLLDQIHENMEVVGSDEEQIGSVERVARDRIILTKSDEAGGSARHSLSCSDIDRVEGNRVILDCSADDAKKRWRDENRSRALFEREDQGEAGPRALDRSFEGTYR